MPLDPCRSRCTIVPCSVFTTKSYTKLFGPLIVKRLEHWENTPLNSHLEDFSVDILIYDNLTDEYGEIQYDNYTVVRVIFEEGIISRYHILQDGAYVLPDGFIGWTKERFILWLQETEVRERRFEPGKSHHSYANWGWEYEIYRTPVVIV